MDSQRLYTHRSLKQSMPKRIPKKNTQEYTRRELTRARPCALAYNVPNIIVGQYIVLLKSDVAKYKGRMSGWLFLCHELLLVPTYIHTKLMFLYS